MKKLTVLALFLLISTKSFQNPWGFFAHKKINKMAVFILPKSMNQFFINHIELLESQSINADKRRYAYKGEAIKHYIDIDAYSIDSPFVVMPKQWSEAVNKFSKDTILKYGILPWNIKNQYQKLVDALKFGNAKRSINLAADIGHYIADAHVPLHTTLNYNGQLSNQSGIHAFWESRLPELYSESYNFILPNVIYIDDVLDITWQIIEDSYNAKDSVLLLEQELNNQFSTDKKFSFEEIASSNKKVYSVEYSTAYHEKLAGMVEKRMRNAILTIGSVWFSAWVDAGQPDMNKWEVN